VRSLRRLDRSGLFKQSIRERFNESVNLLARQKALPASYNDHQLKGEFQQYRECHLQGDLLLEYEYRHELSELVLVDIGSHSYLFG